MNYLILLSQLAQAVVAVDALMPQSAGADKFKAVITMVEAVLGSVQSQLPAIQGVVKVLVDGYHATGIFTHKTTPTPAAA